MSNLKSLPIV